MVVQGALWTVIAVSNWAENTVVNRLLHYSNCFIVYLWNPGNLLSSSKKMRMAKTVPLDGDVKNDS